MEDLWILSESGRFVYVNESLSWNDANTYCLTMFNDYLVTIKNANDNEEINNIASNIESFNRWIGFYNPNQTINDVSSWKWIDDSQIMYNYTNWGLLQPNGSASSDNNDYCAQINQNSYWFDELCDKKTDFICNFDRYVTTNSPKNKDNSGFIDINFGEQTGIILLVFICIFIAVIVEIFRHRKNSAPNTDNDTNMDHGVPNTL